MRLNACVFLGVWENYLTMGGKGTVLEKGKWTGKDHYHKSPSMEADVCPIGSGDSRNILNWR